MSTLPLWLLFVLCLICLTLFFFFLYPFFVVCIMSCIKPCSFACCLVSNALITLLLVSYIIHFPVVLCHVYVLLYCFIVYCKFPCGIELLSLGAFGWSFSGYIKFCFFLSECGISWRYPLLECFKNMKTQLTHQLCLF